MQVGKVFLNASFMSTSKCRTVAEGFRVSKKGNALIEVDCSENFRGWGWTYAVDIEDVSYYGGAEKEVLFYPYSGFRVTEVRKSPDGVYHIKLHTLDTMEVERLPEQD